MNIQVDADFFSGIWVYRYRACMRQPFGELHVCPNTVRCTEKTQKS